MPKKRNRSSSSSTNSSPTRGWGKVKSGGNAFKTYVSAIATRSRKLNNKVF